jgi:SET domain
MTNNPTRTAVTPWGKEHQLTATEAIKAGEVIVADTPLVAALDANAKYSPYAWDLVEKILASTDLTQRYYALRLKTVKLHTDLNDQKIERELAKKHRCTRDMVKNLYFGVSTHNLGFKGADGKLAGHGVYPIIGRANHSCWPNATYQSGDIEAREITLVALHDIVPGEAITWSYANTPSFQEADYTTRNLSLVNNFGFACNCERCQQEIPSDIAKLPNPKQYFQSLINEYVRSKEKEMTMH